MEHWKNLSLENIVAEMGGAIVEEVWKDIIGFEGLYQVSTFGRVKGLARNFSNAYKYEKLPEMIMTQKIGTTGYPCTVLSKNNKKLNTKTHRLVGVAFIPNPEGKPEINHKWGIITDNRYTELDWMTHRENVCHARDVLKRVFKEKGSISVRRIPVIQLYKDYSFAREYPSIQSAAEILQTHHPNISKCCLNKRNFCAGYRWMYKEDYEKMIGVAV